MQTELYKQKISWAKFIFQLKANEEIHLPTYKGSTLRGGFGNVFKRVCCTVRNQDCLKCILKQNCPYAYIFETPNQDELRTNFKADYYPHPFVIEPPLEETSTYMSGDMLSFAIILFGKGIPFLPYFIYAFDQLGKKGLGRGGGQFNLEKVFVVSNFIKDEKTEIYDYQAQILNSNYQIYQFQDIYSNINKNDTLKLQIQLLTPLRVTVKGKLINKLSFGLFFRTLLRRISLLGKIHCEGEWNLPYQEIIEMADKNIHVVEDQTWWSDWERYSSRQNRRMKLGGLVGEITFGGQLTPFMPLLYLGQFTHLGKNTSFGLGKYVLRKNIRNGDLF